MSYRLASRFLLLTALSTTACSVDTSGVFNASGSGNDGGSGTGGTTGTTTTGGTGGGHGGTGGTTGTTTSTSGTTTSSSTTTTKTCEANDPTADADQDGWAINEGDCDDCNPGANPGAIEIAGNAVDENCDGNLDEPLPTCDENIGLDTADAVQAVQAADLCRVSGNVDQWGIIQAGWTMPDGGQPSAQQLTNLHIGHGVLPDFGPNVLPRGGKKLLALSSGTARRPTDPGYLSVQGFNKQYNSAPAPGLPKESASCSGVLSGQPADSIAISLLVRVPSNVHGFSFDFSFYIWDFPQFVCSQYNDVFFANVSPTPPGFPDGIVSYDEMGSPISVNGANFRVCGCMNGPPCNAGVKSFQCPLGIAQLAGTGFDAATNTTTGRAATGWLTTTVPVEPGSQVALRWGVYDAGDGVGDSTAIIDHWQWITTPGVAAKTSIAQ